MGIPPLIIVKQAKIVPVQDDDCDDVISFQSKPVEPPAANFVEVKTKAVSPLKLRNQRKKLILIGGLNGSKEEQQKAEGDEASKIQDLSEVLEE